MWELTSCVCVCVCVWFCAVLVLHEILDATCGAHDRISPGASRERALLDIWLQDADVQMVCSSFGDPHADYLGALANLCTPAK